jgi:hypothetical protein
VQSGSDHGFGKILNDRIRLKYLSNCLGLGLALCVLVLGQHVEGEAVSMSVLPE